jgi:hypothetical protein
MRTGAKTMVMVGGAVWMVLVLGGGNAGRLGAKERGQQVDPNDPTVRLYKILDSKYKGKLDDFFVLADIFNDPKNPGQPQQHVLGVDYNKDRGFGKLSLHVRVVGQVTPEQSKAYTAKQIFDFGESDSAKFTKTDPGTFGKPGDVYFQPTADGGAMRTASVTSEVEALYERFVTEYLLPALEKNTAN